MGGPRSSVRVSCAALLAWSACACASSAGPATTGDVYQEYECPAPIGNIVREDCSRIALKYEGESVEGSVGVGSVGASASYKQQALREADQLVQVLKEQRTGLCNDFNTCKLSVAEYRERKQGLDDSYLGLLAIRDRLEHVDADGAIKLLNRIRALGRGVEPAATPVEPVATAPAPLVASTSSPPLEQSPATGGTDPQALCNGMALQLARRGTIGGPYYGYPKLREALKGHPELSGTKFYEYLLESQDLTQKKQEYVLVAVVPGADAGERLRTLVRTVNASSGQDIGCPAIAPSRTLDIELR
ncbi:MAG TPA: hypothetical protein VF989_17880 [Polyangiaceae bacterium]